MTHFDVCNGDADGLCALHQLRLEDPRDAVLVTGVKRDIALLGRVQARAGDSVTVLDLSLAANRPALAALLERGVTVEYFDHHFAGEPPVHPGLRAHLDPAPDVCTGIIVDRFLGGRQRPWAIVAAFGDGLNGPAQALADSLALDPPATAELRALGEAITYNAYADSEDDLVVPIRELHRRLAGHADPFRFLREDPQVARLRAQRDSDLALARAVSPRFASERAALVVLPDAPWSRRVRGAFGNELAQAAPHRAHAIVSPSSRDTVAVSVRARLTAPAGADALCRRFPSGGGRAAAAGINALPVAALPEFEREFRLAFA